MSIEPLGKAGVSQNALPLSPPKTGFASQPSEHQELPLDIHDLVVKHTQGTFYFRASGPPFDEIHVFDDDIVIVDRVLDIENGRLVVAVDNEEDAPIQILESSMVFGVVTHVIHEVKRRHRND